MRLRAFRGSAGLGSIFGKASGRHRYGRRSYRNHLVLYFSVLPFPALLGIRGTANFKHQTLRHSFSHLESGLFYEPVPRPLSAVRIRA